MTDESRQASQPLTLLATVAIALVTGAGSSVGINHFRSPEVDARFNRMEYQIEARLDRLESSKALMEYQIEELRAIAKCNKEAKLEEESIKARHIP